MDQANQNNTDQSNNQILRKSINIFLFIFLIIILIIEGIFIFFNLKDKQANQKQILSITKELNDIKQINNELQQTINSLQSQTEKFSSDWKEPSGLITKMFTIASPDKNYNIFLEKEYNKEINRYVRQSVVLLNNKTGLQKILKEIKLTNNEALTTYTENGCNEEGVCCNSLIDFNEFKPISWLNDEMILVEQYLDNYECAGAVTEKFVFNKNGNEYFDKNLISMADYTTKNFTDKGWTITNICNKSKDSLAMIIQKTTIFGGYSYVEFNTINQIFTNQLIEKDKIDNIQNFYKMLDDCTKITDEKEIKKYFIEK